MKFGAMMFPTDYSIGPAELARAAEELGFESLWIPEHTHMPVEHAPWPSGGELPRHYSHSLDPFVALAAAAVATQRILLGTGICLVIQHDPITLAKVVATLDQVSNGRVLFGIGAGWNRPEIENHGVPFRLRWRVMRERVLAMKEIWTKDEAEFHGQYVNFDPIWAWPKPAQKPHPPVIMGGDGPKAIEGLLDYCEEWLPRPGRSGEPFAESVAKVQRRAAEAGRGPIPMSVFGAPADPKAFEEYQQLGAKRCLLRLPSAGSDEVLPMIERYAEVVRSFRG